MEMETIVSEIVWSTPGQTQGRSPDTAFLRAIDLECDALYGMAVSPQYYLSRYDMSFWTEVVGVLLHYFTQRFEDFLYSPFKNLLMGIPCEIDPSLNRTA